MFDKLKKSLEGHAEQAREMRAHPGPADLMALPPRARGVGGLGAVPTDVAGAYIGMEIAGITPLSGLGPEASSLIGDKIRERMRAAGTATGDLQPGELVAGQQAARLERMRSSGMTEEQIAMVQDKIAGAALQGAQSGWTIEMANGNRASVQLFDLGAKESLFTGLKAQFDRQHTRAGATAMMRNPAEFRVTLTDSSPYEAYTLPGKLAARGRAHDADVKASHLGTNDLERTLAAIANLALFSLEG